MTGCLGGGFWVLPLYMFIALMAAFNTTFLGIDLWAGVTPRWFAWGHPLILVCYTLATVRIWRRGVDLARRGMWPDGTPMYKE